MGKPANWKKMSEDEKHEVAMSLLGSIRGQYIMAQALDKAIGTMKKVPSPNTEVSNIEDMEMLRETIFDFPIPSTEEIEKAKRKFDEEMM